LRERRKKEKEVMVRQGRRSKQQLYELKEKRIYWKHQLAQSGELALAVAMDLS
jgi:hypothetical protein